jgi:hypothetical protein
MILNQLLSLSYSIIVDIFKVDLNLIQYENAEWNPRQQTC